MNKNNLILIIIALIVIVVVGLFVSLNFLEKEEVKTPQVENSGSKTNEIDPKVQKAVGIRSSMKIATGTLYEVSDDYFTIEKATPKGNAFDPVNMEMDYEYKKIKVSSGTEIVDMNDIKYFSIPENLGVMESLKDLKNNYANDYIIYIYAAYPKEEAEEINHEEDIATYIEWSASSKGGN